MDMISHFNDILKENFNKYLYHYFLKSNFWSKTGDIDNYINFMSDLDKFNYSFMINAIKSYFEYIDVTIMIKKIMKDFSLLIFILIFLKESILIHLYVLIFVNMLLLTVILKLVK